MEVYASVAEALIRLRILKALLKINGLASLPCGRGIDPFEDTESDLSPEGHPTCVTVAEALIRLRILKVSDGGVYGLRRGCSGRGIDPFEDTERSSTHPLPLL